MRLIVRQSKLDPELCVEVDGDAICGCDPRCVVPIHLGYCYIMWVTDGSPWGEWGTHVGTWAGEGGGIWGRPN